MDILKYRADANSPWQELAVLKGEDGKGIGKAGTGSFAEIFNGADIASGSFSHAEGCNTVASELAAHAEGYETTASGAFGSHAEGWLTTASGQASHAECDKTIASGHYSHAEGRSTIADGAQSHAGGLLTKASSNTQYVFGRGNIEDKSEKYVHIIGNGKIVVNEDKTDYVVETPSNAHTLDWEGNAWYQGTLECAGVILTSPNGTKYKLTITDSGNININAIQEG